MRHARDDYNRIQDPAGLIPEDEPVFLIRGQDALAPVVLAFWAVQAEERGARKAIVRAALKQRDRIIEWQRVHGSKTPDMPEGSGQNLADANPKDPTMSDTQDVEALVARLERQAPSSPVLIADTIALLRALDREVEEKHRAFSIAHDRAMENGVAYQAERARVSSLETQLAGAKEALEPFARVRIPGYLPNDLWTTCSTYTYDEKLLPHPLPDGASKPRLSLWLDGMPLSVFRRARAVYEALASAPASAGVGVADLADYDAGLLNDWGGGNVDWWQDYLRAEIGRANDFWRSQIDALTPSEGRDGKEVA